MNIMLAVRKALSALESAGVTHFRDGGDPFGVWKTARELAPEYGITYLTPCFAIHTNRKTGLGKTCKKTLSLILKNISPLTRFTLLNYSGITVNLASVFRRGG